MTEGRVVLVYEFVWFVGRIFSEGPLRLEIVEVLGTSGSSRAGWVRFRGVGGEYPRKSYAFTEQERDVQTEAREPFQARSEGARDLGETWKIDRRRIWAGEAVNQRKIERLHAEVLSREQERATEDALDIPYEVVHRLTQSVMERVFHMQRLPQHILSIDAERLGLHGPFTAQALMILALLQGHEYHRGALAARFPAEAERQAAAALTKQEGARAEALYERALGEPHDPTPVRILPAVEVRPGAPWVAPLGQVDPADLGEVR